MCQSGGGGWFDILMRVQRKRTICIYIYSMDLYIINKFEYSNEHSVSFVKTLSALQLSHSFICNFYFSSIHFSLLLFLLFTVVVVVAVAVLHFCSRAHIHTDEPILFECGCFFLFYSIHTFVCSCCCPHRRGRGRGRRRRRRHRNSHRCFCYNCCRFIFVMYMCVSQRCDLFCVPFFRFILVIVRFFSRAYTVVGVQIKFLSTKRKCIQLIIQMRAILLLFSYTYIHFICVYMEI